MTNVDVIEVQRRKEAKAFVRFPMALYPKSAYYIPPLIAQELATFSRKQNPAFENADAKLFLAMDGSEVVGRIAAIMSRSANEKSKTKNLRFGWFDSVNDQRVATALFDAVEDWGRALGMETLTGPQGFNNLDKKGMLVEGFEELPTISTYYNYPYYHDLVTQYGFSKENDHVEYVIPRIRKNAFPPRLGSLIEKLKRRRQYRVLRFSTQRQLLGRAQEILDLMQETYRDLRDIVPLTEKETAFCVRKFFPLINKDLVKVVVDDRGEMIGFFIAMPSLSRAFQKANGRMWPFGFIHLWKALRTRNKDLDLCLGGVKAQYRGRGVDLIMAKEMYETATDLGFERAKANPMLETNTRVRAEWKYFEHVLYRRTRVYKKTIGAS